MTTRTTPTAPEPRDWGTDTDALDADPTTDLGVDNLAVDPSTDAEALALCALL